MATIVPGFMDDNEYNFDILDNTFVVDSLGLWRGARLCQRKRFELYKQVRVDYFSPGMEMVK